MMMQAQRSAKNMQSATMVLAVALLRNEVEKGSGEGNTAILTHSS